MKINKEIMIRRTYYMIVIIISILPTGYFLLLPVKLISLILLVILLIYILIKYKAKINKSFILFFISISIFLMIYTLYGVLSFGTISLIEFKLIFTTFLLVSIIYLFQSTLFKKIDLYNIYTLSIIFIFLFKVIAYIYGYINFNTISGSEFYKSFFDLNIISLQLPFGIYRIYLLTDMICAFYPFVLALAIQDKLIKKTYLFNLIMYLSLFVVLTSFSRYLIFVFLIGIFFNSYIQQKVLKLIYIYLFIFSVISIFYYEQIYAFYELRFLSVNNQISDFIRVEQKDVLINLFLNKPYFGHGIGAYDIDLIRSISEPFSYEQQILSLLPKFGIVGFSIFCAIFLYLLIISLIKKEILLISMLILFISASFFNPYLFSTNMVIIYSFILVILHDKEGKIINE